MFRTMMIATSLLLATACTTTQSSSPSASAPRSGASKLNYSDQPIVLQTNGKSLLQKFDRDYWVQIRRSSKSEHVKLYAALGAAEWDVAVADARTFLQEHPRDEVALTVLTLGLSMKKNYSLAAYYAKLLNEYHPGNPEIYNVLGLAEMNKPGAKFEDYKEAIKNFESAFNGSESQVASGLNLAQLHLDMGNLERARDVFRTVKGRCDDCNEATLGYGITLSRMQSFAKAEEAFQEVLERDPHNAYAMYYLALVARVGRNDNQLAISHLTKLVQDPEVKNVEMQRKGNFLLRRIQAQVYGQLKDTVVKSESKPKKKKPAPAAAVSDVSAEDLEKAINAE